MIYNFKITVLADTLSIFPNCPVRVLIRSTSPSTIREMTAVFLSLNGSPCRANTMSEQLEITSFTRGAADVFSKKTVIVPILFSISLSFGSGFSDCLFRHARILSPNERAKIFFFSLLSRIIFFSDYGNRQKRHYQCEKPSAQHIKGIVYP